MKSRYEKANEFMKFLEVPVSAYNGNILPVDLYDILTDEKKLKVLISKINNKAFW
jgi:SepF-like predicted cell division protein (DUF552 family)